MLNEALIREVVAYIRLHRGEWDQADFVAYTADGCGTTHCFAGWALRLSGFGIGKDGDFIAPEGYEVPEHARTSHWDGRKDPRVVNPDFMAQILLGFDDRQAHRVFYANQHWDVERFVAQLEQDLGLSGL